MYPNNSYVGRMRSVTISRVAGSPVIIQKIKVCPMCRPPRSSTRGGARLIINNQPLKLATVMTTVTGEGDGSGKGDGDE